MILLQTPPNPAQSGPDLLKTIVIVLFVLSLINERLTNFLKLNLESGVLRPLAGFINWLNRLLYRRYQRVKSDVLRTFGVADPAAFTATPQIGVWNLSRPEVDPDCEKLRERGILNLAIGCGIGVAVLSGADLFELLKTGQPRYYPGNGWWNWAGGVLRNHLPGCVLTGLFISLGSKFWHDVLDLVLYSSNLKRKLTQQEPFTVQSSAELDEFVSLAPNALPKKAIETYEARLRQQYPNITQISAGQRRVGNQVKEVVTIYLRDGNAQGLPLSLPVPLPSGRVLAVETVVIPNVALPRALAGSGSRIAKLDSLTSGTVCCLLFKPAEPGKRYALTCNHVLTNRKFDNPDGWLDRPRTRVQLDGRLVGTWVFGQLDAFFDVALVELADTDPPPAPPLTLKPKPAPIGPDYFSRKKITVLRRGGLAAEGFVLALLDEQPIQYRNGPQTLRGVYELGSSTTLALSRTLTAEGDSGALVYDAATQEALAMIIAGNGQFSYALDLANVFQLFDEEYHLLAA